MELLKCDNAVQYTVISRKLVIIRIIFRLTLSSLFTLVFDNMGVNHEYMI